MKLSRNEIESLKIINHYTAKQGYVGLSILERRLFHIIGFEYALEKGVRVVEITKNLKKLGFVEIEGLSNKITEKGKEFLIAYQESRS